MAVPAAAAAAAAAAGDSSTDTGLISDFRQISLTSALILPFKGNIFPSALLVADVDGDGDNEVVAANLDGDLVIFKAQSNYTSLVLPGGPSQSRSVAASLDEFCTPWLSSSALGTVTCLAMGDVHGSGRVSLVAIAAEGFCHVFSLQHLEVPGPERKANAESLGDVESQQSSRTTLVKNPLFSFRDRVPINVAAVLVADVDMDGRSEIILGTRNRTLHVLALCSSKKHKASELHLIVKREEILLPSQVLSLSLTTSASGKWMVLVGMEDGAVVMDHEWRVLPLHPDAGQNDASDSAAAVTAGGNASSVPYNTSSSQLNSKVDRNTRNLRLMVLGNVNTQDNPCAGVASQGQKRQPATLALCSGLGDLRVRQLMDSTDGPSSRLLASYTLEARVLALQALDLTRSGYDDLVVCDNNGWTYVVPGPVGQDKRIRRASEVSDGGRDEGSGKSGIMRFTLNQRVAAFRAGTVSIVKGRATPVFVYATFKDYLLLFFDVDADLASPPADLLTPLPCAPSPSGTSASVESKSDTAWQMQFLNRAQEFAGLSEAATDSSDPAVHRQAMSALVQDLASLDTHALVAYRQRLIEKALAMGHQQLVNELAAPYALANSAEQPAPIEHSASNNRLSATQSISTAALVKTGSRTKVTSPTASSQPAPSPKSARSDAEQQQDALSNQTGAVDLLQREAVSATDFSADAMEAVSPSLQSVASSVDALPAAGALSPALSPFQPNSPLLKAQEEVHIVLHDVLQHAAGKKLFMQFLEQHHEQHYVHFVDAVKDYLALPLSATEQQLESAKSIRDAYLTAGDTFVEISISTRKRIDLYLAVLAGAAVKDTELLSGFFKTASSEACNHLTARLEEYAESPTLAPELMSLVGSMLPRQQVKEQTLGSAPHDATADDSKNGPQSSAHTPSSRSHASTRAVQRSSESVKDGNDATGPGPAVRASSASSSGSVTSLAPDKEKPLSGWRKVAVAVLSAGFDSPPTGKKGDT